MSATKEITYENIINLRLKIQETVDRGEDITDLEEQLKKLTEAFSTHLNDSGKKILNG